MTHPTILSEPITNFSVVSQCVLSELDVKDQLARSLLYNRILRSDTVKLFVLSREPK
jgi:hypothetical protein